ncbi:hypothetical protein [Xylella fastidiosa]|uniref:hypothetical protein n=1 Tax=Xylella fastidiosa TaxID=2371 RepID=UPI000B1520FA|nr:hypothetical protein [Xylella fastidiosa]
MRILSVSEVSEISGGKDLIGHQLGWAQVLLWESMFLGAFAGAGGLIGAAWGGGWMAGTFIHKQLISMYPTVF